MIYLYYFSTFRFYQQNKKMLDVFEGNKVKVQKHFLKSILNFLAAVQIIDESTHQSWSSSSCFLASFYHFIHVLDTWWMSITYFGFNGGFLLAYSIDYKSKGLFLALLFDRYIGHRQKMLVVRDWWPMHQSGIKSISCQAQKKISTTWLYAEL